VESIQLVLSLQDVGRVMQAITTRPYVEVADLVDNIKRQVEYHAAKQRAMMSGAARGTDTPPPAPPPGNGVERTDG
jgi:hypothetical protein